MTKHLRLMFVAMLTIACSLVGKAADGATYKLVTDASELKNGDVVVIASGTNAMGAVNGYGTKIDPVQVTITDGILKYTKGLGETILESNGNNWYLKFNGQYISYQGGLSANVEMLNSASDKCIFNIPIDKEGKASLYNNSFKYYLSFGKGFFDNGKSFGYYSSNSNVQIYKKQVVESGVKFTNISAKADLNGYNGEAVAYGQLENPNNLPITYTSSNPYVATVDANGKVTLKSWGKTTIIASYPGNDQYKPATTSYELNVINSNEDYEERYVEFVSGTDNGTTGDIAGGFISDEINKDGVKVYCSRASFASNPYRFNGTSTSTISVEKGNIVRIEIVGDGLTKLVKNGEGEYNITNNNIVWTGSAKSVSFKNNKDMANYAAVTNIRVYVEYPNVKTFEYNENEANNIEAWENSDITLYRTLVANKWNTLCVPFAISGEEIKANFGEGTLVEKLDAVHGNTVNFADATSIEAGVPYLIKPTVAGTTYTFNGKEVSADAPKAEGDADVTFQGIYSSTDITNNGTVKAAGVTEGGKVLFVNAGSQTKAFRCFFTISDNASITPAMLKISIKGVETAINSIVMDNSNATDNAVYNLQGQRVNGNSLTKGIYIKNGKKFAVK
ncbi:Ig-like domain-containing protein [uncultured Prevotella sp.]|uniref:Ig-like domain-containing protein n=1 Tax=uncultured Prevotella sp. TaxID=159272 RepID=UPI002635E2AB|nr:Ig-like domain-containing protein [uncultured Prevotella sp.]